MSSSSKQSSLATTNAVVLVTTAPSPSSLSLGDDDNGMGPNGKGAVVKIVAWFMVVPFPDAVDDVGAAIVLDVDVVVVIVEGICA